MSKFWGGFEKQAREYFVYRNITKSKDNHVYSLRAKETGRVEGHTSDLLLSSPRFRVGDSGRSKVQQTGVKNVHAGIHGNSVKSVPKGLKWRSVTYNPKRDATFIDRETGEPITNARYAKLTPKGVFVA